MPYTLKTQQISVKDPDSGEYIGVDVLAEQNKESLIAEIQSEGDLQVERVDQKSAEILAAGDAQVTRINQTGTNVQTLVNQEEARAQQIVTDAQTALNTLETQKNTIAETVASMAELGTDTTLTTPGMAADAKAVGDVKGEVDNLGDFVYDQDSGLSTKAPAITDSASSGDIVTFESDVEGGLVSKLTGTIEPIQDLHGYDNPWPAGGGANMLGGVALGNAIVNAVNNPTYAYLGSDASGDYVAFTASSAISGKVFISGVFKENTQYTFIYRMKKSTESGLATNINVVYKDGSWNALTALVSPATTVQTIAYVTDANKSVDYFELGNGSATSTLYYDYSGIFEGALTVDQFSPYENLCPINGHTGMNVTRTGVNVWDEEWESGDYNDSDGSPHAASSRIRTKNPISCKPTTSYYYVASGIRAQFFYYDINDNFISTTSWLDGNRVITTPSNCHYMRFYLVGTTSYDSGVGINYPATDTAYHAYTGTTIPVSFPTEAGTVYSGTIDPISGKLVVDYKMYEFDGTETGWIKHSTQTVYNTGICGDLLSAGQAIEGFSSYLSTDSNGAINSNYFVHSNAGIGAEFRKLIDYWGLPDNEVATWTSYLAQQKAAGTPVQILGKLKTPIEYQCTPAEVKTLLGTNNIWLDTGTITECVYPKDTKKYIDNKSVVKAPVIINNAEGEIASFTDGAEDMPVKSLVASIEPVQDLHGYDSPWPAGGGKNILNPAMSVAFPVTLNGITISHDGAGTLTINGTASQNVSISFIDYKPLLNYGLKADTQYALKANVIPNGCNIRFGIKGPGQDYFFSDSGNAVQFTQEQLDSAEYRIIFEVPSGTTMSNVVVNLMICLASETDKTFAPYSNICPITGHTGMTVMRTGVNLWDEEWEVGAISSSGGLITATNAIRSKNFCSCKGNTRYYVSCGKTDSGHNNKYYIGIFFYDKDKRFLRTIFNNNGTVEAPSDAHFFKIGTNTSTVIYGNTYNNDIRINYPSTDTAYHPYAGATLPITWESEVGTVYGGTINVVTGKIVADRTFVSFDGSENWGLYTSVPNHFQVNEPNVLPNEQNTANSISNQYTSRVYINSINRSQGIFSADGNRIRIKDDRFSTVADFKAFLAAQYNANTPVEVVYKLATPIEYQLAPAELTTLLGTNNIWTDAGSVSVDYSADTKLFIQNAIAEALSNSSNP